MRIKFNTITGAGLVQEQMFMKKIELSQIKKQIKEFATFLPNTVLTMRKNEINLIHHFVGVLLQGEICGIANVTDKYNKSGVGGIYKLTATLNAYVGSMIEILQSYGGDILKYTGQNFVATWKVSSDDSLFEILHEAVVCALVITQTLSNFDTEVNAKLTMKLAISCGNLSFSVIGEGHIKEFILVGDAITQATAARNIWCVGKVLIAPGAWSHMLQDRYEVIRAGDGFVKVSNVCYKPNEEDKKLHYDNKQIDVAKLIEKHFRHRNELNTKKTFQSNITDSQKTERFTRSLPIRNEITFALKYWIVEDLRPFIIKNVQGQVDEGQPVQYLTETRELTIVYISVEFHSFPDHLYVNEVDKVYQEICSVCLEVLGLPHKVYFIERKITFLVLFGLRGVKHETESQNAIRSAYKIRMEFVSKVSIKQVGCSVTNGIVYCGVVGHPLRREFTVIGEAVNEAYRLVEQFPDTVTCDFKTFKMSKLSSFYFELKTSLKLNYFDDIFEYNEIFDTEQLELASPPLIGRKHEVNFARAMILDPEKVRQFTGVCYHGPHQIGKTAILLHLISMFRSNRSYVVSSVELDSTSNTAYFTVISLYRQIYDKITEIGFADLSEISCLPMHLMENYEGIYNIENDLAVLKYMLLNRFRTIIDVSPTITILIFVDNIEYIDLQSWEILEIAISEQKIRLITSGTFEDEETWDLHFKISLDDNIKLADLMPLSTKYIPALACQFLDANAICHALARLLIKTCNGHPGYVQTCLLRLLNNASISVSLLSVDSNQLHKYYIVPAKYLRENPVEIMAVIDFTEKYKGSKKSELTLAAISLDLFDSYTTYQQMVIKTSAVLGHLFTRNLLLVALKYPSEANLAPVIKVLFEEDILDCGARYAYGYGMEVSKYCCRCHFEDNPFVVNPGLPRYAFCKIMHFKNKSIKEVAYNLLPGNQRIELHLLCTDILEYTPHQCPRCIRDSTNTFINFYKYKDITEYCKNPNMFSIKTVGKEDADDMKEIIKRNLQDVDDSMLYVNDIQDESKTVPKTRAQYEMLFCKCFQIMTRVYKELIYHSTCAGHFGKKIFFSMQYGLLLTLKFDYKNAIKVLTEAKEYCMVDAGLPRAQISESFRKLHVGKIEMGLAKSCIELKKLKAAKNHLAIALRQYNIPSISLYYKVYSKLLTRSFLVNSKNMKPNIYRNVMARYDMGTCLAYCAKLFMLEGKWNFAKLCSIYSIYLLRKVNMNIPILFDAYCSALELYVYSNDMHTCEKLQRYVIRDLQVNYANNITDYFYGISILMNNVFFISCLSGNILKALRLGYRAYDIHLKIYGDYTHLRILYWLMVLLMYNYRLRDCLDMCRIIVQASNKGFMNQIEYYSLVMRFYLKTGFYIEPIDIVIEFAEQYLVKSDGEKYSWPEHNFFALMYLYFMRLDKVQKAEEFNRRCSFSRHNLYHESVVRTLFIVIEGDIYHYLRSRRLESPTLAEEEKDLRQKLYFLKQNTHVFKIFLPVYYCLFAWFKKLINKGSKAEKLLKKAYDICEEQDNILYKCFITHLRSTWAGGFSYDCSANGQYVNLKYAATLTLKQLSQYMTPYPLE